MWEEDETHCDLYNNPLCEYMHSWARAALLLLERFLQRHVIVVSQERKMKGGKLSAGVQ